MRRWQRRSRKRWGVIEAALMMFTDGCAPYEVVEANGLNDGFTGLPSAHVGDM